MYRNLRIRCMRFKDSNEYVVDDDKEYCIKSMIFENRRKAIEFMRTIEINNKKRRSSK